MLGTGGMMPMPMRLTTSVLVRREGRALMLDAGEGIQLSLKRGGLGICNLDAVAISHLHADHVLGLPGVMMFRNQCPDPGELAIIGPPGLERFVRHTLDDLRYRVDYPLSFIEWKPGSSRRAWSWRGCSLLWDELDHSTFCLGYRLEEPQRPGRFSPDRARELGVPTGPDWGRLQSGEVVELDDGRTVRPEQVLGPPRRGRIAVFATDTRPCPGLDRLLENADIAFVEGMFCERNAEEARQKKHMTAREAALAAARAKAERIILVHLSPRNTRDDETILRNEAREVFAESEVARDLYSYEIKLPD
ncbi:MAG: ribonuclease Z [Polyangia bacterium]